MLCQGIISEFPIKYFVYDPNSNTIARGSRTAPFAAEDLWELAVGAAEQGIRLRCRSLKSLPQFSVADLCEMAIVSNATGYNYDAPQLHAPIARIIEMPEIMCSRADGGILRNEGVLDMVNCLRRSDEISFAGGVFVIIKCRERETWQFLKSKGHLVNRNGTFAMIFRPYHLLGVETATSVLTASHLKLSTGCTNPTPWVDVGVRASRKLQQGYRLALEPDHSVAGVMPEILPAKKMASDCPILYYMAAGNSLKITVAEGRLLTYGMIDHDPKSCLWKLRREQDKVFGMPDRK